MNTNQFKRYIKQFGIQGKFIFQDDKKGIRIINKQMMSVKIKGEKGLLVYKQGITKAFVSIFNPKHKCIELRDDEICDLVGGGTIKTDLKDGEYVGQFKDINVLPLYVKEGKMRSNWLIR